MALKTKTGLSAIVLTVAGFLFILIAFCTPCWLVADGTLTEPNFQRIVFFEPTDVPICSKPFHTKYWKAIKYITPNLVELKHIAATFQIPFPQSSSNLIEDAGRVGKILVDYIPNIIITLGEQGVIVVRKASASDPLYKYKAASVASAQARHYSVEILKDFVNVSGAGDCLASGIISTMLAGLSEENSINVGFAAAVCAMFSDSAVPETFFDKSYLSWNSAAKYKKL